MNITIKRGSKILNVKKLATVIFWPSYTKNRGGTSSVSKTAKGMTTPWFLTQAILVCAPHICTRKLTTAAASPCFKIRMESDRIRMESDPDSIFYHILTRIRIRIRMLSDTMQNGCLEFGYEFGYLLDLEHSYIRLFYSL